LVLFFFQAEDGIRDFHVTGVQTCALPISAQAMGVTSKVLEELGIVDETIPEPLGGAHRDLEAMASKLQERLIDQVDRLSKEHIDNLLERRYQRLMSYGNP